jgi:hypothetical protein
MNGEAAEDADNRLHHRDAKRRWIGRNSEVLPQ